MISILSLSIIMVSFVQPGTEPNTFVWYDAPARAELSGVLGLPSRKIVIEVLDEGPDRAASALFYAYFDIFKVDGNVVAGRDIFMRQAGLALRMLISHL